MQKSTKPTKPCYVCGSNAWWQRPDGGWACGRCHPNPNPDLNPSQEGHSAEVLALRDRVKLGNDKLFKAWLQIRELAHDSESWNYEMDRFSEAAERLRGLCRELKDQGYRDCLYLENGKKTRGCLQNPDQFWCQVCPSDINYWGKELMNLPSPRVKSSPPGPEQEFLRKLGGEA